MKVSGLIAGLLLAAIGASAQVSVEVRLDQDQYLPGESITAEVRITNRSGQPLRFGTDPDWLAISVEAKEGFIVEKNGDPDVSGEFTLESAKVGTRRVQLVPYFALTTTGRYGIRATVRIKEWDGLITSPVTNFDIIDGSKLWSQEFGVPPKPGAAPQAPEVRKYTLQQATYLKSQIKLYVRLTDADAKVLKLFCLGPVVSFSNPDPQLDKASNLHVLYQRGKTAFSYTVVNPDGDIILHQTYDYDKTKPRLKGDADGKINVVGGTRRFSDDDVPETPITALAPPVPPMPVAPAPATPAPPAKP